MILFSLQHSGYFGTMKRAVTMACGAVFVAGAALAQTLNVSAIDVRGNVNVSEDLILKVLELNPADNMPAADINAAAQRLRATGFFENVDLDLRGNTLVIDVQENPMIELVRFEGNNLIKDEQLQEMTTVRERFLLDPVQVSRDVDIITQAYAQNGRVNAIIQPKLIDLENGRVNLVFEIVENGVSEIESITFNGNYAFSDRRLRSVLQSKQAGIFRILVSRDIFSEERLTADRRVLTDFYRSQGYADFEVLSVDSRLTRSRDAFFINFNVREGVQYRFGKVNITSSLPDVDPTLFMSDIVTQEGAIYTPVDLDEDISRLEDAASARGLQFIRAEPTFTRNPETQTVDVTYDLVRGPREFIERINIEGNASTLSRVLRQQMRQIEGDPLNPRLVRQSANRIRALEFIGDVDIETRPGNGAEQVIVDVKVQEIPSGNLSFGVNYNPDAGAGLVGTFRQKNFLGRGQKIDVQLSSAEANRRLRVSFEEPYLFGRDLAFGVDFNYFVTNNESASYDTDSFSIKPSLNFALSDLGRMQLSAGLEQSGINDVQTAVPPILADSERGQLLVATLGYNYSWDTRRDNLDLDRNYALRAGQEFGVGDQTFVKSTAAVSFEQKFFTDAVTFRTTVEGGYLHFLEGQSRINDRFFLNSNQMRGFDFKGVGPRYFDAGVANETLGGNAYAVARSELAFPIGLPEEYGVRGGVFADYGSVWDPGLDCSDPEYLYCDFTPRAIAGVSLFWSTPIGPLRFNWTRELEAQDLDELRNFDLTISTSF